MQVEQGVLQRVPSLKVICMVPPWCSDRHPRRLDPHGPGGKGEGVLE